MYQEQFPVQVLGYSDIAKVFHPTALALSSNEDNWVYKAIFANFSQNGKYKPSFLMADGSKAITIACNEVWPNAKRGMCFAHVYRNVHKKIRSYAKGIQERILQDLHYLQLSRSETEFKQGHTKKYIKFHNHTFLVSQMLLQSWISDLNLNEFSEYFRQTWIDSTENGFYEGYNKYLSNNNGLESINKSIKQVHTLRRKMKLGPFLQCAADIVAHWSRISKVPFYFCD